MLKRLAVFAVAFCLAVVPAVASSLPHPTPLAMKGQAWGTWCWGPIYTNCADGWADTDDALVLMLSMDGTYPYHGKTVRALTYMTAYGSKVGPDTYRLDMIRLDVYLRRTSDRIITGNCSGTATLRSLVSFQASCEGYAFATGQLEYTTVRVRGVEEGPVNTAAVRATDPIFEAIGLEGGACDPRCLGQFEGLYY